MKINKEKHLGQLTIGKLEAFIEEVKTQHKDDYKDIPVYIGDDDELNGLHSAWYTNYIPTAQNDEEMIPWRDTFEECGSGYALGDDEVAILIS